VFLLAFAVDKFKQIFSLRCNVETTGYKSYRYYHKITCICTDVRVSYKNNNNNISYLNTRFRHKTMLKDVCNNEFQEVDKVINSAGLWSFTVEPRYGPQTRCLPTSHPLVYTFYSHMITLPHRVMVLQIYYVCGVGMLAHRNTLQLQLYWKSKGEVKLQWSVFIMLHKRMDIFG